ncbi:hypothetical protein Tco_0015651 [Tanacetum coccineum]
MSERHRLTIPDHLLLNIIGARVALGFETTVCWGILFEDVTGSLGYCVLAHSTNPQKSVILNILGARVALGFETIVFVGIKRLLEVTTAQSRRKQKKNTKVPHPGDFTADVPNKEPVPTHSNDPLLSGEDRMKLTELMNMCTKLSERVGVTRRVESSDDESLGAQEDASKQGRSRIKAIDKDAEVTLVETQRRNDENDDNLMFDTDVFDGDEIVVKTEEPVINVAITTKSIPVSTDEIDLAQEITLAQALAAMKSAKPKEKNLVQESSENVSTATIMVSTATTTIVATPAITTPPQQRAKGIAFREHVESTVTTTVPSQKSKDKGKVIMIEPEKPIKKKDQIELDEELAREIEAEEQAELERIQKERDAQEEASRAAIYEEWDNELAELIRERKKFFAAQRAEAIRNKPPTKTQRRNQKIYFVPMEEELPSEKVQKEVSSENKAEGNSRKKSIGRKRAKDKQEQESSKRQRVEDDKEEEELNKCFELAKEEEIAINSIPLATKVPVVGEDFERVLWGDLRVMFEPDVESEVWRSLQGYKIQKMNIKFRRGLLGLKGFLKLLLLSPAGTKVNAARLQLLEELLLSEG